MIPKKLITDESAITVAVETIIFFSISIIFMGMIFLSFQDLNQSQSSLMMEEQLINIGNGIAKKMSDMIVEARISNTLGSHTSIKSDFWIPEKIVDDTYSIKLVGSKILLESTTGTYVSVEVPVDSSILLAENSTIYSNDESHGLEYDSASGALFFSGGGVLPFPDVNPPTISIVSPAADTTIFNTTYINVTVWDDVGVTRVEYFVNGTYKYSAAYPFNWPLNTRTLDDGDCIVTAVAYDAAGNTKPDTHNYTIFNPYSLPPEIMVISPPDGSVTDFHMPAIKAQISDDKEIDFSSIILSVDGYNQISSATFNNVSSKLTTLTYIPSMGMSESVHNVILQVKDIDVPYHVVFANWSFEVTPIIDGDYPAVSIISPLSSGFLVPGSNISVTYLASDSTSGLDNLTINITRNDGFSYIRYEPLSIYPYIVNDLNPQEIWTFNTTYVGGKNYTYRINVYDRSGKTTNTSVGPLTVSLPGQDSQLEVNIGSITTTSGGKNLKNINLRDNVSDSVYPILTKIKVSWITNSTEKITKVVLGGTRWTGSSNSGTDLTFSTPYTFSDTSFHAMDLTFNSDIRGKTIIIIFYLADSTTRMVTFTVP